MIEGLPNVPPALLMLVKEMAVCQSRQEARQRIKGMLRELRDQSEIFDVENISRTNDSRSSSRFEVHLHGAMDLLSGKGCAEFVCRSSTADRIARSVGLIADRVWLTDLLSDRFLDFGRPTNAKLDEVIADVGVLLRLAPLIIAGIVRFRSPSVATCSSCAAHFDSSIEAVAKEVTGVFSTEFRMEKRSSGGFFAHTGRCIEPPMVLAGCSTKLKRIPSVRSFARQWISHELRSALWIAREASLTGGVVLSNSRVGLAGLLQHDGRLSDMRNLLLFDKEREFSIPWVSELNAEQVIQLRHEASSALPAFREKMARAFSFSNAEDLSSTISGNVISDLREQAAEVRAELEAKRKKSAKYWKVTYGLLALGASAYCVAADQQLAGIGGLLSVIHFLINHKTGYESEISKLTSRPGFVLIKAHDILSHAHR